MGPRRFWFSLMSTPPKIQKYSWTGFLKLIALVVLLFYGLKAYNNGRAVSSVSHDKGFEIVEPSYGYLITTASINELEQWAQKGNASAQEVLASYYLEGKKGLRQDLGRAVELSKKAAMQGNAQAAMRLYHIYNASNGVAPHLKNPAEALKWLKTAADGGVNRAMVILGLNYLYGMDAEKIDTTKAFSFFSKASKAGDYDATYYMGECYANSWGVVHDPSMAIRYLTLAADAKGNFFYKAIAQRKLADAYKYGYGVRKDAKMAFEYYNKSALLGDNNSQIAIACAYESGDGVLQNSTAALAWIYANRATGGGIKEDTVRLYERFYDQATLAKIRSKAGEILEQIQINSKQGDPQSASINRPSVPKSSGTGVIISHEGLIVTAAHVVEGAGKLVVMLPEGAREASLVEIDPKNDLAILRLGVSDCCAAPLAPSRDVKLGQAVFTIGFPNTDIQGANPKFTKGEISSVSGIRDEPTQWQISVPVQSGNSGSPLFDESGNVVGIVVSKLNALETAKTTGDLVQNVNYAVKNAYLIPMLEKISDKLPSAKQRGMFKKFESVVEDSKKSVVLILAY